MEKARNIAALVVVEILSLLAIGYIVYIWSYKDPPLETVALLGLLAAMIAVINVRLLVHLLIKITKK
jgi:hypothetical protein